jgi:hypothetical protein
MRFGYLAGATTATVCGSGVFPIKRWNELVMPADMSPNEFDATSVWQAGPGAHAGLAVAICDTASCASGTATQPLRLSAAVQARSDRHGEDHFNGIGWFLRYGAVRRR